MSRNVIKPWCLKYARRNSNTVAERTSGSNLLRVQRHCWSGSQPKSQIRGCSQKQTKLHEPQSHQQGTCRWSRLSLMIFLPGSPLPQSLATAQRHSAERSAGPGLHAPSARAAAGWGCRALLPNPCPEQPLTVLGGPRDSPAASRSHGNQPCTGSHRLVSRGSTGTVSPWTVL